MFKFKSIALLTVLFVLSLMLFQGSALAQKTCVFVSSAADTGDARDQVLINHLKQTYDVALIVDDDNLRDGIVSIETLKQYDFCFVSETVGSGKIKPLKGAPVPVFYTEGYAGRPDRAGWCSAGGLWGTDSTGKVTVVDETGHQLAAGFVSAAEVDIVSGSSNPSNLLTYCAPEIDYIPIAVLSEDPTHAIVLGVEAGTALFDNAGAAIDPNIVSENRAALVGIHADANEFITDDAFKLIDAGINWILEAGGPTEDFVNNPIEPQTYAFVAEFNAMATADSVDGVLGLSNVEPSDYGDLNILLLFNNEGFITAKNGGSYESINVMPYTANTTYAFKQLVNFSAQTYSVWITPEGGTEVLLAEDYAFTVATDTLNFRSVKMSFDAIWGGAEGMVEITDFSTRLPNEENVNTHFEPQTGRFMLEFNARPTADKVDGVIGFSQEKPVRWGEPLKVLFNNQGFVTARNASDFDAVSDFAYSGGMTYEVRMVVDIPMQTYDVWIAPEGGEEVVIAEDFVFDGVVDSLQWRTVIMSFDPVWGGAEGFVAITDFTISDAPPIVMKTCAFIGKWPGGQPDPNDSLLIAHLSQTYDVTLVADDTIAAGIFGREDLAEFDFGFVSESAGTYKLQIAPENFYKVAPVPMFYTENYASQPSVAGWLSAEGFFGALDDSTGEGCKVIIIDDTNHPLSAGFAGGTEVDLVSRGGDSNLRTLTYCVPEIDYIPIAVWAADPELSIIHGIEAGTPLWDDLGLAVDPNLVTEHRIAAVGIYARANKYITEDGFKLIDAGIEWILDVGTAVEDAEQKVTTAPVKFVLSQNYPNPFNPTTEISFSLIKSAHTTLTIHNVLGQVVAKLIDEEMAVGTHHIMFKAENIPSGIYFYQLRSGEFTQTKKMTLMK